MESKIIEIIKRNVSRIQGITNYERNVLEKINNCRSDPVPHLFTRCDICGVIHQVYKSCKNRLCPICNGSSTVKWIAKREAELLPTGYFLLTYTIPSSLRSVFLLNKKLCYDLLFKSMNKTLTKGIKTGLRDFHGYSGFYSILHTWDQRLNHHPHLHTVIPAGCLSEDRTQWTPSHPAFLLPVRKLSIDFRNKLLFYLRKEQRKGSLKKPKEVNDIEVLLENLKNIPWVVNSQPPGKHKSTPEHIVRYLSRYVNKTAVKDERIRKIENGKVYLSYYDRKRKKAKTEIIGEELFLKRLLLNILPKGFKKVRFYGFMANRYRATMLALCRMLLGVSLYTQEELKDCLNDTAFLFWKYFTIDILLCPDCNKGHIHYLKGNLRGG